MDKENRHNEIMRVRRLLEGSLNGKFRETTWLRILAGGYVQEYLDAHETWDWESVRELAQDELKYQRELEREVLKKHGVLEEPDENVSRDVSGDSKPVRFESTFPTKLSEREKQRTDVLLKIEMRQATERVDVKRFRDERLGGQRLLYDEAEAFISPGLSEEIIDWELADLARRLESDYGWRQDEAAWFVLNGAAPRLRPLTTRASMHRSKHGPSYCKITLHAAPWVPSEDVEKAFTQMRDQVRRSSGPGTVGERRLEVLRFVEDEHAKRGRRPNFEELLQMWNREHPHWAYADYRALSKAYREAYQEVVYPEYH